MTSGLCCCADNKAAAGPEATLAEVQHRLDQLVGLAASSDEVQASLQKDTDFGYAWGIIDTYVEEIKRQVGYVRRFQDSATSCRTPFLYSAVFSVVFLGTCLDMFVYGTF